MTRGVLGKCYRTLVVAHDGHCLFLYTTYILYHLPKPNGLPCSWFIVMHPAFIVHCATIYLMFAISQHRPLIVKREKQTKISAYEDKTQLQHTMERVINFSPYAFVYMVSYDHY